MSLIVHSNLYWCLLSTHNIFKVYCWLLSFSFCITHDTDFLQLIPDFSPVLFLSDSPFYFHQILERLMLFLQKTDFCFSLHSLQQELTHHWSLFTEKMYSRVVILFRHIFKLMAQVIMPSMMSHKSLLCFWTRSQVNKCQYFMWLCGFYMNDRHLQH